MSTLFGKSRDQKKPITKFLDTKKDAKDRLRYLKNILEAHDLHETQQYFDMYYSHIYCVFAEMFTSVEADLKQRVSGAHRDALDSILSVFEKILYHCPNNLHHGWQAQSILVTLKKLLHGGNSIKLRREGLRLFMAWYQILQENATRECHALFARLLSADESPLLSGGQVDLRDSVNVREPLLVGGQSGSAALVRPVEVAPIVPPQPSDPTVEKELGGAARYLLDALLAYAASENCRVLWPNRQMQADAFRFVLERFHKHYLEVLFPDLATPYSLYGGSDDGDEPELNDEEADELQLVRVVGCTPSPTSDESPLIPCACLGRPLVAPLADELCAQQEVVIRWFSTLLHVPPAGAVAQSTADGVPIMTGSQQLPTVSKEYMPGATDTLQHFGAAPVSSAGVASNPSSNANTLDAPDANLNAGSGKQQLFCEEMVTQAQTTYADSLDLMRAVLLRDRHSINTLLQVLRQAFVLPVKYSAAIRKVILVYREWCVGASLSPSSGGDNRPVFMREPGLLLNASSERQTSPQIGRLLKATNIGDDPRQAGLQRTVQYIVSSTSRLLLRACSAVVVVDNADLCRRVLSLYRLINFQLRLDRITYERMLIMLVHCAKHAVVGEWYATAETGAPLHLDVAAMGTMARIGAGTLHMLFTAWVRATLHVPLRTDLWDALHDALVSLRHCPDTVTEWGRMLDHMTRALARYAYAIDMGDLPLERLTERSKIRSGVKRGPGLHPPMQMEASEPPLGASPSHALHVPSSHLHADENTNAKAGYRRSSSRKHSRNRHDATGRSVSVSTQPHEDTLLGVTRPHSSLRYSVSTPQAQPDSLRQLTLSLPLADQDQGRLSEEFLASHHQFPAQSDLIDSDPRKRPLRSRKIGAAVYDRPTSIAPTDVKVDVGTSGQPQMLPSPTVPSKALLTQESERALASTREESRHSLQLTDTASFVSAETGDADAPYDGATVNLNVELHVSAGVRASTGADDSSLVFSPASQSDDKSQSQSPQYDYARLLNDGAEQRLDSDDEEGRHAGDSDEDNDDVMMTDDADSALFDPTGTTGAATRQHYSSVTDDDLNTMDTWAPPAGNGVLELEAATQDALPETAAERDTPQQGAETCVPVERNSPAPATAKHEASPNANTPHTQLEPERESTKNNTAATLPRTAPNALVCGGTQTGWSAEAAIVIWRRVLGAIGNVNTIELADVHASAFEKLSSLLDSLVRVRANQGVSLDNLSTPPTPMLVSPLTFLAPTAFEAIEKLEWSVFQRSVLLAFRMLMRMTLAGELDRSFDDEYLAQLYRALHRGLTCYGEATAVRYEIINNCDNRFGTLISRLRGATLLLHDFVYAASETLTRFSDTLAPRARAAAILSNVISMVDLMDSSGQAASCTWTVFVPTDRSTQCRTVPCESLKEAALAPLINTANSKSGDALTRSVALRALGVFLCGELVRAAASVGVAAQQQAAHCSIHLRFGEALKVVLDSLHSTNLAVASTSVSVLGALAEHIGMLLQLHASSDVRNVIEALANTAAYRFQNGVTGRQSASGSSLATSNDWRSHLVALLFTLFEWCMRVPLAVLVEPLADGPIKSLLFHVFNVLHGIVRPAVQPSPSGNVARRTNDTMAGAEGDSSSSPDMADESRTGAASSGLMNGDPTHDAFDGRKTVRSPPGSVGRSAGDALVSVGRVDPIESVQLAARFCLFGLLNQLNHFPQLCGVSRINSTIQEHHNVVSTRDSRPYTDLCAELFAEPNVHLFVVNSCMLVSLIELPTLNTVVRADCATPSDTLLASRGTVRCIVRDLSGKFVWDAAHLYGPPSIGQCCYVDAVQRAVERQSELRVALRQSDSLGRLSRRERDPGDFFDTLSVTSSSTLDADGSFTLAQNVNLNASMTQSTFDDRTATLTLQCGTQSRSASSLTSSAPAQISVPQFDGTVESCTLFSQQLATSGVQQRLIDPLDSVLEYVATVSPECCLLPGEPLNQCSMSVDDSSQNLENVVVRQVSELRSRQDEFLRSHLHDAAMCGPIQLPPARAADSSYAPLNSAAAQSASLASQLCRKLLAELGYVAWEKRWHIDALETNEKLVRELRHLDERPSRDTHKLAVVYVARDQEDRRSILANAAGSADFEQFVAALGWEVDLECHAGFRGGLQSNRSTGSSAPYFATSTLEVVFHVSTRLGGTAATSASQSASVSSSSSSANEVTKLRHLGNDLVMIVFSEHAREFRRSLIPTEFADALIVVEPLANGLYRVRIDCKSSQTAAQQQSGAESVYNVPHSPNAQSVYVGPLFDGAVLDGRLLAPLVRATAINLNIALRNAQPGFHSFYEERAEYLNNIIHSLRARSTFEEFIERVCTVTPAGSSPSGRLNEFRLAL